MELRVLGELLVVDGSRLVELRPLERRLVAALAVSRPSVVRYDALAEAVWGSRAPRSAKHSLQAHVRRVRAAAGHELVATANGGYRLGADVAVDVDVFETTLDHAASTDRPNASARWDAALRLWRGTPFDDVEEWEPARIEQARLVELRNRAVEERCAAALAEFPCADVVAEADALVQAEPLRERRWALLMSALAAVGRRADALRAFDRARRALATELGISPGTELVRLHEALLAETQQPAASPPLPPPPPVSKLPVALTSIIGRDDELRMLSGLLSAGRLVTLTGPGGVGKTRLALEHASRHRGDVSGGAWWVELAATRESAAVEPLIASTFGIAAGGETSARERIIDTIGDREMLVVLDNCEHLLTVVASFTATALSRCAKLRILATSREPLAVAGERIMVVPALPVDDAGVELFVERARQSDPSFTVDDPDAVTAISGHLDGIPLAIELAAARVRTLGISALAARLNDRFDVLTAQRRGPDSRHHTLRAALDWSYELLDGTERSVFAQVSVFRGRFELEAVEQVVSGIPGEDVAAIVASLVDKSMVVADGTGPARFRLLEPLRQYAGERLRESRMADATANRHASYYAELAKRLDRELRGRLEIETARRIDAARDNFRAAFHTAVHGADAATAMAIPVYLTRYAGTHVWSEPWDWSPIALALPGASADPLYPAAFLAASDGAWQRGQHARAVELAETVISLSEPGSEVWREGHRMLAGAFVWLGRFDEADAAATMSVADESSETTDATLTRMSTLALIRSSLGRPQPVTATQLVADAEAQGNPTCLALAWHVAGVIVRRDDPALAVEYQRQAAQLAAAAGATLIEGFALAVLAAAAADSDPLSGAQAQLGVMKHYLRVGNRTHLRSFGRGLIRPLVNLGAYEACAVVDGATGDQPELRELAASRTASSATAREALGTAYAAAAERGATMTDDELVAYLSDIIGGLGTGGSADQYRPTAPHRRR